MKKLNESYWEVKKSKFYGYSFYIENENEVNEIIGNIKTEHKKAKHIVYAYKINEIMKKSDDKEPSNSAGKPLYDLINYKNANYILIVVVRYFGGTLLGRGLLTRSYMNVASKLF